MGVVSDWRLYVDILSWDNVAKTGDLPVRSIGVDADDPTAAKQIAIELELTTATKAIEQGDVIRLDGYSAEAAGWVNILYGEVVELERDSGGDVVRLTGYCAMWWAAAKEIPEFVLVNGTVVREQFHVYNTNTCTLANANQLVQVPLEDLLVREPLLLVDEWDQNLPLQYQISSTQAGGVGSQVAAQLTNFGGEYFIDDIVVYVDGWIPLGMTGAVQCQLRQGVGRPFAGGVTTVIGAPWPLNVGPTGPTVDRYGQNRSHIRFTPAAPVLIVDGWIYIELSIINVVGPGNMAITIQCADACLGAGRLSGGGSGVMWTQLPPASPVSDVGGNASKGRSVCIEVWGSTWMSMGMGKRPEHDKASGDFLYEPAAQWQGYVVEPDSMWNSTIITFAKRMLGSINNSINNVDVFYRKGWGTLTNLINSLYDDYLSDTYDARDFTVTNDEDWVDQKTKYTNALAVLRAVCDNSELIFESYRDLGAATTKLRIRDRKLTSDWGLYSAAEQARRTFKHGDDDTTARLDYAQILACVYKKNKYVRRDITVWDFPQNGKNVPGAAALASGGSAAAWDASCAKDGKGLTIGVEVGGPRADLDPASSSSAMTMIQKHVDTLDQMEEELEVEVADVDANLLATINQVISVTDSRVGLVAGEWLVRGYRFKTSTSGGSIAFALEKRIRWRKSKWVNRKKEEREDAENVAAAILGYTLGPMERHTVISVAFDISWIVAYNGRLLSTAAKIGVGNSSATNSLVAFDSLIASKKLIVENVAGKGKVLLATFEWKDYAKTYGNATVQEVGILDAGGGVIYRRAFKTPSTANWYFHPFVDLSPMVKLDVVILVKD